MGDYRPHQRTYLKPAKGGEAVIGWVATEAGEEHAKFDREVCSDEATKARVLGGPHRVEKQRTR